MAISRPTAQSIPPLTDIQSREGLRAFVTALHLYLQEARKSLDDFERQVLNSLTPLTWAPAIVGASTIEPIQPLQPISGSAPIATILAGPGMNRFILLAEDGFSTVTGGNIAAAVEVTAGTSLELLLNYTDGLWYPQGGGGGRIVSGANSRANAFQIGGDTEARRWFIFWDSVDGLVMEPGVPSNKRERIMVDKTWSLYDVEGDEDILTVDPDIAGAGGLVLNMKICSGDPSGDAPAGRAYVYLKSDGLYQKIGSTVTKVGP